MKIGDKVRFIHSKGEGFVKKIIDQKQVEVEIEDGFMIPVLRSEVVVVQSDQTSVIEERKIEPVFKEVKITQGIYLAFDAFNDQKLSVNLINNTDFEILAIIIESTGSNNSGIYRGNLTRKTSVKVSELILSKFESWPELIVQVLYFNLGNIILKTPLQKSVRFNAESFFKSKSMAPVLNKEAFLYQLDRDEAKVKINPKEIEERMQEKNLPQTPISFFTIPGHDIDLHIEKLVKDHTKLSNGEMVQIQMKAFEQNLDNALAGGMEEIVFIHGTGNGTLKNNIHKALSQNKNIKYYKEAAKEKFGYGGTLVRLK